MGITVTQAASATSSTDNTSLSITGVTAAVGDWLVVAVVADNAGSGGAATLTGVSDGSNTYTERTLVTSARAANAGLTLGIYTAPITSALSNATLTVSFSANTEFKVAQVYRLEPGSGESLSLTQSGTGQAVENVTGWARNITTNPTTGDLVIGFLGVERAGVTFTGDTDNTAGTWTEWRIEVGSGLNGQVAYAQHKVVTASQAQAWGNTADFSTASDICTAWHCFRAEPSAAPLPRFQQHFRQRVL